MERQYRHGDVFVRQVPAIPKKVEPVERDQGRVILAYGEVTGHAHAFGLKSRVAMFRETGSDGHRFLDVTDTAELKHEEHSTIAVPPGQYEVVQQREYSPEAVRNVAD